MTDVQFERTTAAAHAVDLSRSGGSGQSLLIPNEDAVKRLLSHGRHRTCLLILSDFTWACFEELRGIADAGGRLSVRDPVMLERFRKGLDVICSWTEDVRLQEAERLSGQHEGLQLMYDCLVQSYANLAARSKSMAPGGMVQPTRVRATCPTLSEFIYALTRNMSKSQCLRSGDYFGLRDFPEFTAVELARTLRQVVGVKALRYAPAEAWGAGGEAAADAASSMASGHKEGSVQSSMSRRSQLWLSQMSQVDVHPGKHDHGGGPTSKPVQPAGQSAAAAPPRAQPARHSHLLGTPLTTQELPPPKHPPCSAHSSKSSSGGSRLHAMMQSPVSPHDSVSCYKHQDKTPPSFHQELGTLLRPASGIKPSVAKMPQPPAGVAATSRAPQPVLESKVKLGPVESVRTLPSSSGLDLAKPSSSSSDTSESVGNVRMVHLESVHSARSMMMAPGASNSSSATQSVSKLHGDHAARSKVSRGALSVASSASLVTPSGMEPAKPSVIESPTKAATQAPSVVASSVAPSAIAAHSSEMSLAESTAASVESSPTTASSEESSSMAAASGVVAASEAASSFAASSVASSIAAESSFAPPMSYAGSSRSISAGSMRSVGAGSMRSFSGLQVSQPGMSYFMSMQRS